MLKEILKTVALVSALSVSATAVLLATCSQNPTQVKTIGQNNMSAAVTPAISPAKKAKAITSNGFAAVHIIGTDNTVYKYTGPQTWTAYTSSGLSGNLPSRIAIPYNPNANQDTVYVLAGTQIYRHSTDNFTASWKVISPQGVVAKDIACGGKTNGGNPPPQLLWKLGTDNYIYYYQGSNWTKYCKAKGYRGTEVPQSAKQSHLVVDYMGNVFGYLPVSCGSSCGTSTGHITWDTGSKGDTWQINPYDSAGNGSGNRNLDIYGVQDSTAVSMATCDMCFGRYSSGMGFEGWQLFDVMWGNTFRQEWSLQGDDGTTGLINLTGVTESGGSGGPWVIATNVMPSNWGDSIVFESTGSYLSGGIMQTQWVIP